MNNSENKNLNKEYYEYKQKYKEANQADNYDQLFNLKSFRDYFNIKKIFGLLVAKFEQKAVGSLLLAVGHIDVILDVPCGTGKLIPYLLNKNINVIGIDASAAMLSKIETRDKRLKLIEAEINKLPLDNDYVDLTICHRFLHRIPPENYELILKEIYKVSKEYAILYFAVKGPLTNLIQNIEKFMRIGNSRNIYYMTKTSVNNQIAAGGWDFVKDKFVLPMGISSGYLILVRKKRRLFE